MLNLKKIQVMTVIILAIGAAKADPNIATDTCGLVAQKKQTLDRDSKIITEIAGIVIGVVNPIPFVTSIASESVSIPLNIHLQRLKRSIPILTDVTNDIPGPGLQMLADEANLQLPADKQVTAAELLDELKKSQESEGTLCHPNDHKYVSILASAIEKYEKVQLTTKDFIIQDMAAACVGGKEELFSCGAIHVSTVDEVLEKIVTERGEKFSPPSDQSDWTFSVFFM